MCKFIIDSGSCTNVISEEAISKLALFTEPHPAPYKLVWLNSKTEVRISKRCRVPFSVGPNYKDLICCDVMPMEACHFGKAVAIRSCYAFSYENRRITLLPSQDTTTPVVVSTNLPSPPMHSTLAHSVLLLSKTDFTMELRSADVVFAVVAAPGNEPPTLSVLPAFTPLITEFRDIFPTDLPEGLPLLHDIQHGIDLIPNAALPNR